LNPFYLDIQQQPAALRQLAARYRADAHGLRLRPPQRVLLTGMGASYHVALWASYLLQTVDIWAVAIESVDLIHYSRRLIEGIDQLVFISQSGASAEVLPVVEALPPIVELIAVTNEPANILARHAHQVITIEAGEEAAVACKTYVNSLACMWWLARAWQHGDANAADHRILLRLAERMEPLVAQAEAIADMWLNHLGSAGQIFFLGHGPHMATARQSSMMLGEWAKHASVGTGIGAFRHGLIEIADADTGVVVFGLGGMSDVSTRALINELRSYGVTIVTIVEGEVAAVPEPEPVIREFDEMLGALLDIIPVQIFAEALARHLQIEPGFRHISKVVRRL
jgi:glutamine---fructose-6-phosphate transaminase (isomerizing)